MTDDESQAQSKLGPRAIDGEGSPGTTEPAQAEADAAPDVSVPDPDDREAQVKAVAPSALSALSPAAAPVPAATPAAPSDPVSDAVPAQVKAVQPSSSPLVPPTLRAPTVPAPPAPVGPPTPPTPSVPTAPPTPPTAPGDDDEFDDETDDDLEPEFPPTFTERLQRLSPALVILSVLSIGSLIFLALAMTSHTTPVPVLLSSAVVTGLAFGVDAVVASFMTWHAGQNGEGGKALLLALVGGMSAVIAAGAFAGTLILALLLKG